MWTRGHHLSWTGVKQSILCSCKICCMEQRIECGTHYSVFMRDIWCGTTNQGSKWLDGGVCEQGVVMFSEMVGCCELMSEIPDSSWKEGMFTKVFMVK